MKLNASADHPSNDLLERYAMGKLTDPDLEQVEEHLFVCDSCRTRLAETDAFVSAMRAALHQLRDEPLDLTHYTEDGPIRLLVEPTGSGEWRATFGGQELEGACRFGSVAEANDYVLEAFRLMFAEHECDERCG
jgi:hypothetical protein